MLCCCSIQYLVSTHGNGNFTEVALKTFVSEFSFYTKCILISSIQKIFTQWFQIYIQTQTYDTLDIRTTKIVYQQWKIEYLTDIRYLYGIMFIQGF